MKISTAKIVIGISLALSVMVVLAEPQKFCNRTMTRPQPQYQDVQMQPQYPNVQVQPQYQYPNVQVQPQYQYQYPNVQVQPQYQYPNRREQPWCQDEQDQQWYGDRQEQSWYGDRQEQPRHRNVQVQGPRASQYESPKKPKKTIFVGELNAGGEAKEVAVNRVISQCYLEIVSGTVSINTVVVRPEKRALPQTTRLTPGQLHVIDLGGSRNVTGFRISDNGRGVYRVFVK